MNHSEAQHTSEESELGPAGRWLKWFGLGMMGCSSITGALGVNNDLRIKLIIAAGILATTIANIPDITGMTRFISPNNQRK